MAVFSPVAAHLAKGTPLEEIGAPVLDYQVLLLPIPKDRGPQLEGEIILFDRFGDAITNIPREQISERSFWILCKNRQFPFHSHYEAGAQNPEKLLALINSDRLLELSAYKGNIQKQSGLAIGEKVWVTFED